MARDQTLEKRKRERERKREKERKNERERVLAHVFYIRRRSTSTSTSITARATTLSSFFTSEREKALWGNTTSLNHRELFAFLLVFCAAKDEGDA